MKPFFVYMLRCADGSYYTGHTDELEYRVSQHEAGTIEGCYTHERRPVALVWSQETATRAEALAAEQRIKGWSRAKKEALIRGDWERISELARSHGGLRQAQPGASTSSARTGGASALATPTVRPELVEGPTRVDESLRQALAERGLAQRVLQGDRRALAKAITLVESSRADHRAQADGLLNELLPHTGRSLRIGISGVPGVGKSTFIEALGLTLLERGHRIAVLAVDPSSSLSGGSILGDKTRMEKLSVSERAFIRPSPTAGALGGVAEHTREALLLSEAAGYDVVIVETVGVGQSETAVAGMTDLFVLLQLPNAGDDLQAIKRGVMELADIVVINKADLDAAAATRAQAQITSALRVFGMHGNPARQQSGASVLQVSALKAQGVAAFWQTVETEAQRRRADGSFERRRRAQALAWLWDIIDARLKADFKHHPDVRAALQATLDDVENARMAPSAAARRLLGLFEKT